MTNKHRIKPMVWIFLTIGFVVVIRFLFPLYQVKSKSMLPAYQPGKWLLANRFASPQLFEAWILSKPKRSLGRIVALPGEGVAINSGILVIDGITRDWSDLYYAYRIWCSAETQLDPDKYIPLYENRIYTARITPLEADSLKSIQTIRKIEKLTHPSAFFESIFPHYSSFPWSRDQYGPVTVPEAGDQIRLTKLNYKLYLRLMIDEGAQLKVEGKRLFINGLETDRYVVKKDYYWMMCDNRHAAIDSRNLGFVAQDELIGKSLVLFE